MNVYRQSTAANVKVGPFVDAADGVTPMTSLTITQPDIRLTKNGGAFAQKNAAQTLSHDENGWYTVALDTTDTNTVGVLEIAIYEAGALPCKVAIQIVEEAIYDAFYAASATGLLPANVTQFGGSAGTFASGRPEVNASHAGGTAWGSGAITAASIANNAITAAKIQDGALTAAKFAAGAFNAVWTVATRLLTAGTNISLAKGTGVTGFNDLDAAGVRSAVGLSSANLDSQLAAIDSDVGIVGSAVAGLNDLSAAQVNAEVLDVLNTDTFAEPTGVPPAAASLAQKLGTLYMMARNKVTVTATKKIYYDDGDAAEFEKDLSDDGTTYEETEVNAP